MIDNERFIDKSVDNLLKSIENSSDKLYKDLLKYLAKFDKEKGNLNSSQFELILALDGFVRSAVFDTKVDSAIKGYLSTFDKATGNIISINEEFANNAIKVNTDRLLNDNKKFALNNIKGIGFENVTKLIQDILYKGISNNSSVIAVEQQLKQLVLPDNGVSILERHFGQVAQDSLYQHQGTINQKIIEVYEFKAVRYVPLTEVADTRPICHHITQLKQPILITDLKKILDNYCPNGRPSKDKITYSIRDEVKILGKGAGMIDGTNINNFFMNRGGYRCRHQCIGALI